ncbi:MAG: amino acid adenylation domain-containing protein, partial [Vicinamibacterales bacterium]
MHTQDLSPKKLALLNQLLSAQGIDASVLPITRLNHEGQSAPLSFAQEQLWIAHHLEPESPAYNVHVSLPVRPGLPSAVVERSLFEICRRHEVLRTTFPSTSGRPVQVVHEEPRFAFEIRDFQSTEPAGQDRAVAVLQRQVARAPFDLANGPLLRATLARMPDGKQSLLLTMHHIVTDAWSMGVFVREFRELSEAYAAGQPSPLPNLTVQYSDFAAWQRAVLTKARLETGISYWRRQLEGVTALDLPTDRRRPAAPRFEGRIETVTIDARLADACRELGRRSGATTFTTLLSAFNVLLSLYAAGRRDIVVGVPVAGRDRAEIQPLVGYFVNTLAVRTRLRPGARFNELLRDVQRVVTEAFAHQDVPFDQVTAEVAPDRDFSRHPVFQVLFNLLETTSTARDASAVSSGPMQHASQTTRFDLEAHVVERPGGLDVSFIYNTDVFDAGTVRRMAGHYLTLLDAATAGPDQRVDSLARLTAHDRKLVVEEWNRTARDYPGDATIPGLFEARADLRPHAVAVEWRDQQLEYAALDARANQVAHALQRAGVGTDGRVGVLLDRGLDLIVALLGISKAGAAYLAMDPSDPPARVAGLFVDAGATAMIVAERLAAEPFQQFQQIDMASTAAEPTSRLGLDIPPDALAYVGSTSGSTGRPKGVEVTHRGVVRLLFGSEFMHLGPDETLLSLSPVSFDLSTLEIWGGLLHGGRVVVYPERLPVPSELGELLHTRNVTSMWLTSSLYNTVIEQAPWALRGLRQLLIGGEALSVPHIERGLAELSSTTLINGYGPTENTTFTSCYCIPRRLPPESTSIPIGPPIANTTAFVLDPSGEPLPIGVPGELCTGGDGLARGYARAPRLTAERFIPDAVSGTSGGRLYKTGDLARWRDDGTLEFLGRRDGQIKLRGFRIELGELEAALSALPGVSSCAAAVHETAEGKRLVAYVVPSNGSIDTAELRRALQDRLPAFMVPASIVSLEALPLTPSGKTDRRALPRPEVPAAEDRGVEAPRTPTEETLARIFAEVFRRPHVSVHDDFLSLGGDSILSIQIASRAGDTGLKVRPRQLFEYPTVAELAAVVGAHAAPAPEAAPPNAASAVSSAAPLTPIQHWFLDSDPVAPHHFNQALMLQVRDGIDAGILERAVDYLTHQHEALCSRFQRIEGDWEQHIGGPPAESSFAAVDLHAIPEAERAAALAAQAASVQAGFDIQTGPVFRAVLFDLGHTTPRRLLLSAHHLVIDGVSWRVLLDDLTFAVSQLTDGRAPAPRRKTTAVHDWAAMLVEQANRHGLDPAFWIAQAGRARALGVSPGAADARVTAGEAAPISCSIGREQTALVLREIPRSFDATIEEVLLAALARAFAACGHGSALFLDLERHGRSDAFDDVDLSRTVGWFTTVFPLLLDTQAGPIETMVESVGQRVRAVPNDGLDWGLLRYLAASHIRRRMKALDEPRISFNYLGQFDHLSSSDAVFTLAADAVGPLRSPAAPCRYALEIVAAVRNGELRLDWIIGSASYPRPAIERLAAAFGAVVDEMTRFAGRPRGADEPGPATDRFVADSALAAVRSVYDDVDDVYPLTAMQQAMLFHSLLHPEEALYTELVTLRIEGPLNADALREAWRVVVNRHEALRCVFAWEGMPVPVQVVRHRLDPEWVVRDESGTDTRGEQDRLQAVVVSEQQRAFDFARGPLMRFALVRVSTARAHLVWTFHHALLDGWSVGLVLRQVQEAYQALVDGTPVSEATPPARHRGYVEWLQAQPTDGAKAYWKALLHDVTAPTPVGIVRSVDHGSTAPDPADRTVHLDPAVVERLLRAARSLRVTPNTVLIAAWALVLSRYSDRDDVVFGTTVSGRPPTVPGVESMVGLFINTVPVRVVVPTAESAAAWLKSVHDAQLDQREHEYLPLVEITQCSAVPRGTGLFDTMFVFENYPTRAAGDGPSAAARTRISADSRHRSNYPLVLVATLGERLILRALYDRRRVDGEAVTRLLRHMTNALIELIDRPHLAVGDLRLVTDVEQTSLVGQGRGARPGYPEASLGALFA